MKRVAVLMTVHNRKEKTLRCFDCLYANKLPEGYELVVFLTDDGCTDGTCEAVREKYPNTIIIKGNGNLYWSRGTRLAWSEASKYDFDFYLWLNDDTYIYDKSLAEILFSSEKNFNSAILVGATQSEYTKKCTYGVYINEKPLEPNGNFQECYNINGNFVLIPRDVFKKLGNIDNHYHHSGGDTYYGLLAQKNGVHVYLIGEYVGTCESHEKPPKWTDPNEPFIERWRDLNKPNGMPLGILFYHQRLFYGLPVAVFHILTTIFRCCCPRLWEYVKSLWYLTT